MKDLTPEKIKWLDKFETLSPDKRLPLLKKIISDTELYREAFRRHFKPKQVREIEEIFGIKE